MSAFVPPLNYIGDVPTRWPPPGDDGARPQAYVPYISLMRPASLDLSWIAIWPSETRKSLEGAGRAPNGAPGFIATEMHQSP